MCALSRLVKEATKASAADVMARGVVREIAYRPTHSTAIRTSCVAGISYSDHQGAASRTVLLVSRPSREF